MTGLGVLAPPANDTQVRVTPSGFAVRRLTLTNFRNYGGLRLEAEPRPVVLTGANGAGKTNLLEAISYLSPGRGLHRARLDEVTSHGSETGWAVAARVRDPRSGGVAEIGTGTAGGDTGDTAGERRAVRIDGVPARGPASLAEVFSVSWLTPQMDRLFQENTGGRRRFLDRLVYGFDTAHARRVTAYERALRERSRLLRSGEGTAEWLAALEETMAEYGVAVAAARREGVARLEQGLTQNPGAFPRAALGIDGLLETLLDGLPALEVEAVFRAQLADSRPRDAETGGAAVGPHRSDLTVRHLENGLPAQQCSTGEQKALLIAIVLADARVKGVRAGAAPVLLLDEVVAHLDEERREALLEEILGLGAQTWLTGTDRTLFAALEGAAQFFEVVKGRVSPGAPKVMG